MEFMESPSSSLYFISREVFITWDTTRWSVVHILSSVSLIEECGGSGVLPSDQSKVFPKKGIFFKKLQIYVVKNKEEM